MHASQQRGKPLAKFSQGHHQTSVSAHPVQQVNPGSAHPGHQPHQGPSLMQASQHRGGPPAIFSRASPDQHNPRGGGAAHAPPQGVGLGADPWGRPLPQWQGQQPAPSPPSQWQLASQPPPQPPQGAVGGGGAAIGLDALGLSDATLQAFTAAMQGVVTAGVVSALPSPSPAAPGGKVARLSLLHLRFACRVAGDDGIPPLLEAVALGQGKTEGLAILNQALMRGLTSCRRVFGRRAHFSASLPLLAFIKIVSLRNPSLNPASPGGGVHSLAYSTGYGQGVHPYRCRRLPPGPAA